MNMKKEIAASALLMGMLAAILFVGKEAGGSVRAIDQKDIRVEDIKQIFASQNLVASNFNLSQKVFEIFK